MDGVDDDWDRFADFAEYDRFTRAWLGEARRLLQKDGTIWVVARLPQHLPHRQHPPGPRILDPERRHLAQVQTPCRTSAARRFTNAHETLIWAARGRDSRYRFNYQAMKALNDDLQMRSDWLIPLCTGAERLRNQAASSSTPTQKPEALLHRILLSSTMPEDVVLDPFLGTGTTAAVARRLHRRYIGIERHPAYVEAALGRIRRERPASLGAMATAPTKRDAPRLPFGTLVERGLIPPAPSSPTATAASPPRSPPTAPSQRPPLRQHPQGRRRRPERPQLQRLDLLAPGPRRSPHPDRRPPPGGPRRTLTRRNGRT